MVGLGHWTLSSRYHLPTNLPFTIHRLTHILSASCTLHSSFTCLDPFVMLTSESCCEVFDIYMNSVLKMCSGPLFLLLLISFFISANANQSSQSILMRSTIDKINHRETPRMSKKLSVIMRDAHKKKNLNPFPPISTCLNEWLC